MLLKKDWAMIIKLNILIICILCSSCFYSQSNTNYIMLDVDSLPVLSYKGNQLLHSDTIIFIKADKSEVSVDMNIQFKKGLETYHALCDSNYFRILGDDFQELNATAYYIILFDDNYQISEVRIYKRLGYSNLKYDNIVKEVILQTNGNWGQRESKSDKRKWHVFIGRFKLR